MRVRLQLLCIYGLTTDYSAAVVSEGDDSLFGYFSNPTKEISR